MNYASSEKLLVAPLVETRRPLERSLLTRIAALKTRLDNFTVVDAQGETVGEIRNLVLYKQRLHLVIVQPDVHRHWRFVLLSSPLVRQVNSRDRTIFVRTTHADINYLPEQRSLKRTDTNHHAKGQASVLAPVTQLPALQTQSDIGAPLVMDYSAMSKAIAETMDVSVEGSSFNTERNEKPLLSYPVATPAKPVMVRVGERGA